MTRRATQADLPALTALALRLWPDHDFDALRADLANILQKPDAAFFLQYAGSAPIGFAQCQLRHDYVEGTRTSPVGYLEGIFVQEAHRHQGHARRLLAACEAWTKEQGCTEFASDCELDNTESLHFHLAVGFAEANRIICFHKKI